ncbi:methyltransferase domain-containing protein [Pseudothauera rhizosphaerae]|uniref:Malonyl-[acyl-carrier protein] O-methyltransferase n=1 Tax=Pseudothauera rhizosphaerae TaxID=2565932 RepID=A0A4S4AU64_9RHOO|nr:methyltransferase domain-containing protein [Pseudothauera rhizosphaerae]THF63477.1 methyltransferase domain-containing protein [Pseudothauera rhizosphaerae]
MLDTRAAKAQVRRAFHRAAPTYDRAAQVQREVCARLAALAAAHACRRPVKRVLDAGCGTGHALDRLAATHPGAQLLALDFAPGMLARISGHGRICGDLEHLPLAGGCLDALWSSLALQWCAPDRALGEIARVLAPGGTAWLATLGPQTLHELRAAFRAVDGAAHVIDFHPLETWQTAAETAGLAVRALECAPAWALAPDLRSLLAGIKAIGAHSVGSAPRKPLGRAAWRTLAAQYEGWRRPDGLLPATYDVILLAVERPQ